MQAARADSRESIWEELNTDLSEAISSAVLLSADSKLQICVSLQNMQV